VIKGEPLNNGHVHQQHCYLLISSLETHAPSTATERI
jgi:hypothetical protein